MSYIVAVLIDTISIQNYVYSGNRLSENVGASNIVSNVYKKIMYDSINTVLGRKIDMKKWESDPDIILFESNNIDFEVGYIGGGNALIFFKDKEKARHFIYIWTKTLLKEAPGLNTAVAIEDNFDLNNFQSELKNLFDKLRDNKNMYFPKTFLPKHGITADCPYSGMSAEVLYEDSDGIKRYISSISKAKLDAIVDYDVNNKLKYKDKSSNENNTLEDTVEDILKGRYTWTTLIDELGQTQGRNHVAIVHIDGNSIGQQFMKCETLPQIRKLSISVKSAIKETYHEFIEYLVSHMSYFCSRESGFFIRQDKDTGKIILPFRSLLMAGDDITFITDGRLGVPFAKKYMELLSKKVLSKGNPISENYMSACAGVAITGAKYPFYRGYTLAEELCSIAKKSARENPGTSWLDFHIEYEGFSGSIEEIRSGRYSTKQGNLNFGPYLVCPRDKDNEKDITHLINGIKLFLNIDQSSSQNNKNQYNQWPKSRVKELRTVLTTGHYQTENLIKQLSARGLNLYELPSTNYHTNGWENHKTPYFDMIELLEFYSQHFLINDIK